MSLINSIKFITNHPLTCNDRVSTLWRWFKWQLGSRLIPGAVVVSFVENTRLIVKPGMRGATGNIYTGLHEFEDMAFVLHVLRQHDLFMDVGANVGTYSVLAAGVVGTRCITIEPVPSTFAALKDNIAINELQGLVVAYNIGLAKVVGELWFSSELDTVNHVMTEGESVSAICVPVRNVDDVVRDEVPSVIKIDVEGYEAEVLAGGDNTLKDQRLLALVLELNGSGLRYGIDETEIIIKLKSLGFMPYTYQPFKRTLVPLEISEKLRGNILFIRDLEHVAERVRLATPYSVLGKRV